MELKSVGSRYVYNCEVLQCKYISRRICWPGVDIMCSHLPRAAQPWP